MKNRLFTRACRVAAAPMMLVIALTVIVASQAAAQDRDLPAERSAVSETSELMSGYDRARQIYAQILGSWTLAELDAHYREHDAKRWNDLLTEWKRIFATVPPAEVPANSAATATEISLSDRFDAVALRGPTIDTIAQLPPVGPKAVSPEMQPELEGAKVVPRCRHCNCGSKK
ncbi:MAG: hypothetical protein HYV60_08315 [Planctomycetia bacterium]|nr:hypothetical protein [Planctomycetia bacterium]